MESKWKIKLCKWLNGLNVHECKGMKATGINLLMPYEQFILLIVMIWCKLFFPYMFRWIGEKKTINRHIKEKNLLLILGIGSYRQFTNTNENLNMMWNFYSVKKIFFLSFDKFYCTLVNMCFCILESFFCHSQV